jgi:hypothetical protein
MSRVNKITKSCAVMLAALLNSSSIFAQGVTVVDPSGSAALSLANNASIQVPGEQVVVNSTSPTAFKAAGLASVDASAICVEGGSQIGPGVSLSSFPSSVCAPVDDPFGELPPPTISPTTTAISCGGNDSRAVSPGSYIRITASNNCVLHFEPGIYAITSGGLTVSGNASLTGSEVMIYNAGSGSISVGNNTTIKLTPPSSGLYNGITIFQARNNPRQISWSAYAPGLLGTIYAQGALLSLNYSALVNASIVVKRLGMTSNATVKLYQ